MLVSDIGMLTADFGMLTAGTWYVDFSFCELFELHLVLCFFVIFANFLFFLTFFRICCFFLCRTRNLARNFAFGWEVTLVCGRGDSHRGPVPALDGAG